MSLPSIWIDQKNNTIDEILNLPNEINRLTINCYCVRSAVLRLLGNIRIKFLYICGNKFIYSDLKYLVADNIDEIMLDVQNINGLKYLLGFKQVVLKYANQITDQELKYLSNATEIRFMYCPQITEYGLKYLTTNNITMYECHKIKYNAYRFLKQYKKIKLYNDSCNELKYFNTANEILFPSEFELTNKGAKYLANIVSIHFINTKVNQSFRYLTSMENIYLNYDNDIPKRTLSYIIASINTPPLKTITIKSGDMNVNDFVKKYFIDLGITFRNEHIVD